MNGESRTGLIQLIARKQSLSDDVDSSFYRARPIVTYLGVPPVRLDTLGRGRYCGVSAGCNYRRIPRDRADRRAVAAPPGKKMLCIPSTTPMAKLL
jgi:hypothetical protein